VPQITALQTAAPPRVVPQITALPPTAPLRAAALAKTRRRIQPVRRRDGSKRYEKLLRSL